MTELKPIMITVPEAMRVLGVGRTTLYLLIQSGKIERVHIGRRSLITWASIERFTDALVNVDVT